MRWSFSVPRVFERFQERSGSSSGTPLNPPHQQDRPEEPRLWAHRAVPCRCAARSEIHHYYSGQGWSTALAHCSLVQ